MSVCPNISPNRSRKNLKQQILTFWSELIEQRHQLRGGEVSAQVMDSEAAGADQKQPDGARASAAGAGVRTVPGDLQPGDKQCHALQSLARVSGQRVLTSGVWMFTFQNISAISANPWSKRCSVSREQLHPLQP